MRESFVFHESFIAGLPEDRKTEFIIYIIGYGLYEEAPALEGMDKAFWNTIQTRIDADKSNYNERKDYINLYNEYRTGIKNGTIDASTSFKTFKTFKTFKDNDKSLTSASNISNNSTNTNTQLVSEFEFDSVFEFDIDNVSVSDASITPPQKAYAEKIFAFWKENNLPGSKDSFSFLCKEFKKALPKLKGLHSDAVFEACKNYVNVLNDENCFVSRKYCFDSFVESKTFTDCLPDRFVKDNFKRWDAEEVKSPASQKKTKKKIYEHDCPSCHKHMIYWNEENQKFICDACDTVYKYEDFYGD